MSYLLDTNVVCELVRPRPAVRVERWIRGVPDSALHLSALTVGEIRRGVERMPVGRRKERLRLWLEQDLPGWFGERLLAIDVPVAECWGRLGAASARSLAAIDSLLAATALHHGLRLVTRNVADFNFPGLEIVNPWSE